MLGLELGLPSGTQLVGILKSWLCRGWSWDCQVQLWDRHWENQESPWGLKWQD